jgi:hypothetical protein
MVCLLDGICYSEASCCIQMLVSWSFSFIACELCVVVVCSVILVGIVMLCNSMWYSSYRIPYYGDALMSGISISCSFVVLAFLIVFSVVNIML